MTCVVYFCLSERVSVADQVLMPLGDPGHDVLFKRIDAWFEPVESGIDIIQEIPERLLDFCRFNIHP